MADFAGLVSTAYGINAIAFFPGLLVAAAAISSLNEQNWIGIFLTLPLAVSSMLSSLALSVSCIVISWDAERLACFAVRPSRLRLLDTQRDLVWGLCQYFILALVAGFLLCAMAYRYSKPRGSSAEHPQDRKHIKKKRLAVLTGGLLSWLWPF